jgi:polysaccharide biosynthesis/export protein
MSLDIPRILRNAPKGILLATSMLASAHPLAAQNQVRPKNGEPVTASATAAGYRIGAEDILQISVFGNEALSRTVPVRPDGMISLPLINDVTAAGLTPMELRDVISKKLVEFVPKPEVAVIVTEVKSLMVSVMGQVMKPGRYDLKTAGTVIDALAMAGGFKEFAERSRVVVLRNENGTTRKMPFDYDKMSASKQAQENFALRPGDIVIVP